VQQVERGEIQIIRNGQSLSPLYAGFPIEKGDQISTAHNAEAVIDFEYGIRAYLRRNTQVSLSSLWATLNEVLVRIPRYFFQIKGYFDLKTDDASAIAQGTEYYVRVSEREASYLVLEGRVLVQPKPPATWQPIHLGQNEKVIIVKGQPPRGPLPADPQEIASIRQWRDGLDNIMRTDPTKEAIDRIRLGRITGMPPPTSQATPGVAGTRMTIENRTGYTLRVYFRGPASRLVEVPNGQAREVSLVAGPYQVAAETLDRKVTPFYGEDTYQPQRSYKFSFYIRSQRR
jgi:hypothetical protein